jgi:hypothetical protein
MSEEKKGRLGKIFEAVKLALKTNRQNEKENVRGFDEGGSSIDEEQEEAQENQPNLQSAIEELQESLLEIQREEMEMVAQKYRDLGLDCEVEETENGFGIVMQSGDHEGQDLLTMSAKNLEKLLKETGKELEKSKKLEKAAPEESEEREEKEEEKEVEIAPKEDEENKVAKPMAMLPGDVVEERSSKENIAPEEKKKPKEKGKKPKEKNEGKGIDPHDPRRLPNIKKPTKELSK